MRPYAVALAFCLCAMFPPVAAAETVADESSVVAAMRGRASVLLDEAGSLGREGYSKAELMVYEMIVDKFGDSADIATQAMVLRARINAAALRLAGGDREASEIALASIVEKFRDNPEEAIREQVAMARVRLAEMLEQSRPAAAIGHLFAVMRPGSGEAGPALRETTALAVAAYCRLTSRHPELPRDPGLADELLARLRNDVHPGVMAGTARALLCQAAAHAEAGRGDDAVVLCNEIESRYGTLPGEAFAPTVAGALLLKGVELLKSGDRSGAARAFAHTVSRYGESPHTECIVIADEARRRLRHIDPKCCP